MFAINLQKELFGLAKQKNVMARPLAKTTILWLNLVITFFLLGQTGWSFLLFYSRHSGLSFDTKFISLAFTRKKL